MWQKKSMIPFEYRALINLWFQTLVSGNFLQKIYRLLGAIVSKHLMFKFKKLTLDLQIIYTSLFSLSIKKIYREKKFLLYPLFQ